MEQPISLWEGTTQESEIIMVLSRLILEHSVDFTSTEDTKLGEEVNPPALKGGACGALAGRRLSVTKFV